MKDKIVEHKNAYMRFSIVVNWCNCALADGTVVNGTKLSLDSSTIFVKVTLFVDSTVWSTRLSHRTVAYKHAFYKKKKAYLNWNVTHINK